MSTTLTAMLLLKIPVAEAPRARSPRLLTGFFRMTVNQYERLMEAGGVGTPSVELIQGLLVTKMSKN